MLRFVFLLLLLNVTVSIVIKNGGYEDVYIFVQDSNEENEVLLKRIQEIFTDASKSMFFATWNRIYFRKIRIFVPKSWSVKPEYKQLPTPSLSRQYIIVDKEPDIKGITAPHVTGLQKCRGDGIKMYLNAPEFILTEGLTKWGPHDHVIVHEWGHLRWGLFDEYKAKKDSMFYQENGTWQHVRCTKHIKGIVGKVGKVGKDQMCETDSNDCNTNDVGKKMSTNCTFCPYLSQSVNASLMSHSHLKAMTMFCDEDNLSVDESQRHNKLPQNLHNVNCESKSAWEIMRNHTDFLNSTLLPSSTDTAPEFEILQSSDRYRVFVLDVSGSMNQERLTSLRQAGEIIIQEVVPEGSWLGIVIFSSSAATVKNLIQIKAQSDRDALKASLPQSSSGGTCIGCGMDKAIGLLKLKLSTAENTELIVITDGENNEGNIQASTRNAVAEKVIVYTIGVTQQADKLLANISQDTGGKTFTYEETGNISFIATFSETINNDMTSTRSQHITLASERIDSISSDTLMFAFPIEGGLGANTSVTVISRAVQNFTLELTGPNNYNQILQTSGTYATLVIPDVAQAGQYEMKLSIQQLHQTIEYFIKTTPTSNDIVRVTSWLSSSKVNLLSGELPIVFVGVSKGYAPLVDATVTALVVSDGNACELTLKAKEMVTVRPCMHPDILSSDGYYSEYILPQCLRNGRVSIKVSVSGQKGETKIVKNIYGAPALVDVDDPPETYHETFQRVQIMEALHVIGYQETDTDIVSPGRITDVDIYHIVKETNEYGENRNFTISWTATGDDKATGQASSYIMRTSDDFDTLLNDFDSAEVLEMNNNSFLPKEAGQTEALKFVVNAEHSYTDTAFFALQAIDKAGNKGAVSNILSIVVAKGYRALAESGSLEIDDDNADQEAESGSLEIDDDDADQETEPGSLEIDTDNAEDVEDTTETTVIIAGSTAGVVLILMCFLVIYIFRKRRLRGSLNLGTV